MKHVEISEALKAKLKHPKDIIPELKNKAPALVVVDKTLAGNGGCFICGEEHFARDCPQGGGGGSAQARGRSKGAGRGKGPGGSKGDTQPRAKSKPQPRPNSPVPPHAAGKAEGEKTNKDIEKENRLPGFCQDFQEGKCNRDITGKNPTRCTKGAHLKPDEYKKFKEKNKETIKAAKEKRNRSKTPAAR